jgi:hypothetical protein
MESPPALVSEVYRLGKQGEISKESSPLRSVDT